MMFFSFQKGHYNAGIDILAPAVGFTFILGDFLIICHNVADAYFKFFVIIWK
jgi:hypothetical protein